MNSIKCQFNEESMRSPFYLKFLEAQSPEVFNRYMYGSWTAEQAVIERIKLRLRRFNKKESDNE